jgi:hypothetical protein
MSESPSFHAASCRVGGCDWSTLRSSMLALYGDPQDHLKCEHDYSDAEWQDTRRRLEVES